ncbi:MAG: hypothetical protein ABIJ52_15380 [Pseudomonadota bacterium]
MRYLVDKILKHWKDHRPKMYQAFTATGLLEEAGDWVNERAEEEILWLAERGTDWWEAEKIILEKFMFPSEEEQATLTYDQMPFLQIERFRHPLCFDPYRLP